MLVQAERLPGLARAQPLPVARQPLITATASLSASGTAFVTSKDGHGGVHQVHPCRSTASNAIGNDRATAAVVVVAVLLVLLARESQVALAQVRRGTY